MASKIVSPPFHDIRPLFAHTLGMSRKQHQRSFLKEWRKHRGYTQDRLSEMTGLSKPFISQIETGKRQYTQELLELFANALACSAADIIVRDPTDPDGLWSIYDQLEPVQRRQVVEIAKTLKRTG